MWTVLSGDFDINLKPEKCLENVLKNTNSGDIVLFHDSLKAYERMEYALPRAMEYWNKEGYEFKGLRF
jgi:peptidoglycan/xylan/chitin deacetylase (PgdA/CDA1 family)